MQELEKLAEAKVEEEGITIQKARVAVASERPELVK